MDQPPQYAMLNNSSETVSVILSKAQALVLFEFLSRFSEQERLEIHDPAERRVLWDIPAKLETELPEPLRQDYDLLLKEARESIRDAI